MFNINLRKMKTALLKQFANWRLGRAGTSMEHAINTYEAAAEDAELAKKMAAEDHAQAAVACKKKVLKAVAKRAAQRTNATASIGEMDKVIRRAGYAKKNITEMIVPPEDR